MRWLLAFMLLAPMVWGDFNPRETGYLAGNAEITATITSPIMLDEVNYTLYAPQKYDSLTASTMYSKERDKYGNERLVLNWKGFGGALVDIKNGIKNSAIFSNVAAVGLPYVPPRELFQYVAGSQSIPLTDEIREKAREISSGSENAFEAVASISHWVYTNVKYDIAFGGELYDSSWVYKNRKGTCDEFSNIFIAMVRSIGIPARYAAGIVYSKGGWDYHAWAEVYLDGWFPVDPTWNEVGWLDASHIPMGSFVDGKENLATIGYIAEQKTSIKSTAPKATVDVIETRGLPEVFYVSYETFPKTIGSGRYAVIEAKITNTGTGCLATSSEITSRIDDNGEKIVSFEGGDNHLISICPGEDKKVHFIMKSRENLPKGYVFSKLSDIKTFLGKTITPDVEIDTNERKSSALLLRVDRAEAEKGERVGYEITGDNYRVYSTLPTEGDKIIASKAGSHYIIAIDGTGNAIKKELKVIEKLPFKVTSITHPDKVNCGDEFNITFSVDGAKRAKIEIEDTEDISFDSINDTQTPSKVLINAKVSDKCSSVDQFTTLDVGGQKYYIKIAEFAEKDAVSGIGSMITGILQQIIDFIKSLIP